MVNRVSVALVGLILVVMTFVAACGPATPPTSVPTPAPTATLVPVEFAGLKVVFPTRPPPDIDVDPAMVAQGEEVFLGTGACITCHTIQGVSEGLLGPELTYIGADAATRRPGYSAEQYITESIRQPEVFVAEGVERATVGLMTTALVEHLTDDEVAALTAFLLTQQ